MALVDDLIQFIREPAPPGRRDELAVRLFLDQYEAIPELGRARRGGRVTGVADVPGVPETLYRGCGPRRRLPPVRSFRSSGTSGQGYSVVELSEEGLALMDAAILAGARRRLRPSSRFLMLTPDPLRAPDSVMCYGMALIARHLGDRPPRYFVEGAPQSDTLRRNLEGAVADRAPVVVAGGTFAVVRFVDDCLARGWRVSLPAGSQVLDAGGFKGRSREVTPAWLRGAVRRVLGVPEEGQVNLLGMTELASQLYDSAETAAGPDIPEGSRVKVNDPWNDTAVIDPRSGAPTGGVGMLRHVDLAIYDRPCGLLTADLGMTTGKGFCFVRRAHSSGSRGCSLMFEGPGSGQLAAARGGVG